MRRRSAALKEKHLLQAAVSLFALVPLGAGLAGVLLGPAMVQAGGDVSADSHFRYLSGLLLGVGLLAWSCVPNIERRTERFRALTAVVVTGGLGRLLALALNGAPDGPMLFGLVMELGVTPALCLWQGRIAAATPMNA